MQGPAWQKAAVEQQPEKGGLSDSDLLGRWNTLNSLTGFDPASPAFSGFQHAVQHIDGRMTQDSAFASSQSEKTAVRMSGEAEL